MARTRRASQPARDRNGRAPQSYNGVARAQVADLQRARMLAAMFDVATERGAANVSVAHIVERSGVSRRTFYEAFSDREDCFLAAFEQALEFASARVLPAYRAGKAWRERIRAALIEFLSFLDDEPVIGTLLVAESFGGGPRTLKRRARLLTQITKVVDEGRNEPKAASPAPLTAEGVVGGALSVIHTRLVARPRTGEPGHAPLIELTNPLMSMIVLPYMGSAASRRELDRPVETPAPQAARRESALLKDPFKEAGMRLTYRTVRVLTAVADNTGASNRVIGNVAGMTDQGQISKLLARLERVGLIANTGLGPGQGAPNAWALTERGRGVTDSIRTHTSGEETR